MNSYLFSGNKLKDDDNTVTYLCPFCPAEQGIPGRLTIWLDKSHSRVTLTECTKGFANCCAIAELLAGMVLIYRLNKTC